MRTSWSRGFLLAMVCILAGANLACAAPARTKVRPPQGAWLGAFVQPVGAETEQSAIEAREQAMGRRLDMVQWYYRFDQAFPTWREPWAANGGRQNLISWAGVNTNDVAAGKWDTRIDANARSLKAFGRPLLLRWFAEMDTPTVTGRAVSPAAFVKAWRHIVQRFRNIGVPNVDFVWCPSDFQFRSGKAQQFYPGDSWVDWLCADGYNWAPAKPKAKWVTFGQVFADFYAWAAPRHKPIVIGEAGAVEDPAVAGRKGAWIRQMGTDLQTMPAIKAVVWFDAQAVARSSPSISYNWRIGTSASSRTSWRAVNALSYFNR